MKITIKVSKNDIEAGMRSDCKSCPVALAIARRLKKKFRPAVGSMDFVVIGPDCMSPDVYLSEDVRRFIRNFDLGLNVEPFTFKTEIPAKFLKGRK
jgi:hypothetical protein